MGKQRPSSKVIKWSSVRKETSCGGLTERDDVLRRGSPASRKMERNTLG